jgi:UDP-N-acetylglucosamine diphosphorylase / glucose-1-phosphate thymidylyltransferase / UDP-N-acetylgalactosamine diphosphorylase / glucosamine-1-phosphate N-acetyltransferase / galactosamine-1-phosphate N-acetyltransferase
MYYVPDLLDLSKSIAASLFDGKSYPWEVLDGIGMFTLELGKALPQELFDHPADDVWIAKNAQVALSSSISGPCIIDCCAEIRHCAFIRGNAVIGKNCVVGNSTELKNVILFDYVQVPHYNYVGDSILGYRSHMGAGAITSNVKSDKSNICVKTPEGALATGRRKFGTILGDFVEIGCNTVLNPGSVIGRHTIIYPASCVRGVIPENSIYKSTGVIVPIQIRDRS